MRKNLDLVSLIGGLHEGVVDDAAWSRAISDICDIVDVPKLLMGRIARGGRSLDLTFAHRANLIQAAMLSGPLADPAHNPWLRLAETHPLRTPATVAHLGGRSALEEAAIWPNFYVLFQLGDSMGAALERQPEYTDIVVVARPAGATEFDTANVAALAEILPHLARSWRVRHALIDMQRTVGTLTHILDRFERAVVVAGPSGEVRFANAAADRLLTRGGAIDAKSGRLRATRHDQTKALHALIEAATRTATGRGDVAVDAMALSIEDQPAALSVVAEPLAPAHARAVGHLGDAGALLFIGDSEAATKPPLERLRIVYGMTEAEARITSMIAAGHSIASLAPGLGVSPNTAKFHLKNIFEKVGASMRSRSVRQASRAAIRPAIAALQTTCAAHSLQVLDLQNGQATLFDLATAIDVVLVHGDAGAATPVQHRSERPGRFPALDRAEVSVASGVRRAFGRWAPGAFWAAARSRLKTVSPLLLADPRIPAREMRPPVFRLPAGGPSSRPGVRAHTTSIAHDWMARL